MNFTDTYEFTEKAMAALKKIKENRIKTEKKIVAMNESKIPLLTTTKPATIEEYSEAEFIRKKNMDSNIYSKLIMNLTESQKEIASGIIKKIEENIKEIYQLSNIKPKIYGFSNLSIDSSKNELIEESNRIIGEFFKNNYYNLTNREREKKYSENVVRIAHEIVCENQNIEPSAALAFSYKSLLVKDLLRKVNIPYFVDLKIKELLESDVYQEFFDSERLHISIQELDSKIGDLAKIISISL